MLHDVGNNRDCDVDHRNNTIHIVTIGDQLDELCSFSGSLPYVYLY